MHFLGRLPRGWKWSGAASALAVLFFLFFVLGPLFFIFSQIGAFRFTDGMREAIINSFAIGLLVTFADLLFGIPLAWLLARKKFPLKGIVDAAIDLPLIVPTSALGLSFVLFWGPGGAGLFALIDPRSAAWPAVRAALGGAR